MTRETLPEKHSKIDLHCAACGMLIAAGLDALPAEQLQTMDGEDALPQGRYSVANADSDCGFTPGAYLINLADAHNTLPHADPSRRCGCCGVDGINGLNTLCANGHEIGTEYSDCWMPHHLTLDPARVTIKEHTNKEAA